MARRQESGDATLVENLKKNSKQLNRANAKKKEKKRKLHQKSRHVVKK